MSHLNLRENTVCFYICHKNKCKAQMESGKNEDRCVQMKHEKEQRNISD